MRIASAGHLVFAAILIALGVMGLVKGDFTAVWQPVPESIPARQVLAYLCALISLASGIGLLWRRTAALAARVLLAFLVLWFLLWRVRAFFVATLVESTWSAGATMVLISAAWVLFVWFASDWDRQHFGFVTGERAIRIARVLYALGLVPFGIAHFMYLKETVVLIPGWLPWHVAWAYFTGAAFIAVSFAVMVNVFARLAVALSVLQMGLFAALVWIPRVVAGSMNAFQWSEFVTTLALTAAGWMVLDSYRHTPWLARGTRSEIRG